MPPKQMDKKREGTSKDHDFAVKARSILEQAIGEHLDGTPLDTDKKNEKFVERARKVAGPGARLRQRN